VYDENCANLEYMIAKHSNIYNKDMSILKFFQTSKRIENEYIEKLKALSKK